MNYILALSLGTLLFCLGLWPLATLTVLAFWLPQKLRGEQRRQDAPNVCSTFEQKQLMAILAALETGQYEKASLLEKQVQLEW